MSPSLSSYGFFERLKLNSALGSVTRNYGLPKSSRRATQEAIKELEFKVKSKPTEWIFWSALSDWYSAIGSYAKAVYAAEKCYELRPRDPRSAYFLGAAFRLLTRAQYVGHPKLAEIQKVFAESGQSGNDEFDPVKSLHGLEELNLTVDEAAEKAMTLYEETITLGVNSLDANAIREHLASMYAEFPHLNSKVKGTRKPTKGLFAEVRGDPFNEAVDHHQKLKYLVDEPLKMRAELVEIIRLCQLGIERQKANGDAYVLMADAYFAAALHTMGEGYKYCLPRAAAVIYEWRTNRLASKNRERGKQVYRSIQERLEQPMPDWMNISVTGDFSEMHNLYYQDAVNPESIGKLERILANA